ncbi:N-acetylmuramate alpha-1-phosphate uridylyltransferase MurU [Allohahella marinimesophila]|uniref:Nucleotidyltransferase family protein n=1 Tax=Allohahella marinimesophila TaxID=1054972 RepID=A0ABP7PJ66_9GAMM
MTIKALILAAGYGTRMRPLTEHTPKPLLKAGGRALIEYTIEGLVKAGLRELVINHAWLGEQIEAALGDGSRYGAVIRYSAEREPLETAGGIRQALPLLAQDDSEDFEFIVTNGDVYCEYDYSQLLEHRLAPAELAHVLLTDNPDHNPAGDFLLYDDGRVRTKPLIQGTAMTAGQARVMTFSGIGRYRSSMFSKLPAGAYPLAPVLRKAMDQGAVTGQALDATWLDIGTVDRLQALDRMLQSPH